MRLKEITSPQNPLIKDLAQLLSKSKERRRQGRFLIEGLREVERALTLGYPIESLIYCPEHISSGEVEALVHRASQACLKSFNLDLQHIQCSEKAFAKLAYRHQVANIVAIAQRLERDHRQTLIDIKIKQPQALVLVLEGIEKPGNLGAILRTADAFGVDGVVLVNCHAELEHPNSLRNSLGAALALPVIELEMSECIELLAQLEIPLYVTHLNAEARFPNELPLDQACAIILGAEATGASDTWLNSSAQATLIPMVEQRIVDSLNVSVAAAVMLYEVNRQRNA